MYRPARLLLCLLSFSLFAPATASAADKPAAKTLPLIATGRKGPIALRLTLRSARIKRGESVGFRLEIANVSRSTIIISNNIFRDPSYLGENTEWGQAAHILALGPDGQPMYNSQYPFPPSICHTMFTKSTGTPAEQEAFEAEALREEAEEEDRRSGADRLVPGASVVTPPWIPPQWAIPPHGTGSCKEVPLAPPDEFTLLWNYKFTEPGRYRLKAVYDSSPNEVLNALNAELGRKPDPEDVRVETGWLDVVVK